MKQARFWIMHPTGGLVRVKLNEGETLNHFHSQPTDEGYYWEGHTWSFNGRTVHAASTVDSRDCDGRYRNESDANCDAGGLSAGYLDESGLRFPAWRHVGGRQRDYSAEAMNY